MTPIAFLKTSRNLPCPVGDRLVRAAHFMSLKRLHSYRIQGDSMLASVTCVEGAPFGTITGPTFQVEGVFIDGETSIEFNAVFMIPEKHLTQHLPEELMHTFYASQYDPPSPSPLLN